MKFDILPVEMQHPLLDKAPVQQCEIMQ
ncbi:hypothetical protein A2U01_0088579, partial [Trifolium medium]|nr:hypothetical protein [Trifolium medium]